ncbi:fibroblast growth factor-binding protein 1 [Misgurnus anguillicaudatus]|uniref:fibroblast growth factor-binding protein 1 n=1 Tax=Misgurnus anguillicaudatus TaxID=75329 RepID=UPI0024348E36|nr:fibroblast growth factor-binding protein 1 [Misgurnus anguillicaudatus]
MQRRNLLFILSHLFLLLSFSEAKKKSKPASDAVTGSDSAAVKALLGSGQLSTKDGHRCTWETLERGTNVVLQVSCSVPGEEGLKSPYTCEFAGKPQECSVYNTQSSQYWKQVVSKLKKRNNACEGEKVLKTRLCKKAPSASHMKLTERSGEQTTTPMSEGVKGESKRKTEVPARRSKDAKKEKEREVKKEEDKGFGDVADDGYQDTEPYMSYCGEGWSSVCNFFVKFFDG